MVQENQNIKTRRPFVTFSTSVNPNLVLEQIFIFNTNYFSPTNSQTTLTLSVSVRS